MLGRLAATVFRASSAFPITSYNYPKRVLKLAYPRPMFADEFTTYDLRHSRHLNNFSFDKRKFGTFATVRFNKPKFGPYATVRDHLSLNKPKFETYPRVMDLLPAEGKRIYPLFRPATEYLASLFWCS